MKSSVHPSIILCIQVTLNEKQKARRNCFEALFSIYFSPSFVVSSLGFVSTESLKLIMHYITLRLVRIQDKREQHTNEPMVQMNDTKQILRH